MAELSKIPLEKGCGKCGYGKCRDYADPVVAAKVEGLNECPHLGSDLESDFEHNLKPDHETQNDGDTGAEIKEYLSTHNVIEDKVDDVDKIDDADDADDADEVDDADDADEVDEIDEIQPPCKGCGGSRTGALDRAKADFSLGPIPGEPSCREDLYPLARFMDIDVGDVLRYRPLGCPVVHFAKVMKYSQGIATVHLAGPHSLLGDKDFSCKDAGICMVTGFEGAVIQGRVPDVGETIRFVPSHCRMQQVHSGVIVHSEGSKLRIEGIDLKVWR